MPLIPVFERALAPLIEPGFVRIVTGGPDVGEYLTAHPGHRPRAHHRLGGDVRRDRVGRRRGGGRGAAPRATRRLDQPITGELGGVSPIIVVPGALDRRRPALPGRARRRRCGCRTAATTASPARSSSSRPTGRSARRSSSALRDGLRRRPGTAGVVPPRRTRSSRPRHPPTRTPSGSPAAPARSST